MSAKKSQGKDRFEARRSDAFDPMQSTREEIVHEALESLRKDLEKYRKVPVHA